METAESWYRRMQALLYKTFRNAMAEFILFDNDIQHFHSIEYIQRHSERQLPDQVSVDDGIRSRT